MMRVDIHIFSNIQLKCNLHMKPSLINLLRPCGILYIAISVTAFSHHMVVTLSFSHHLSH